MIKFLLTLALAATAWIVGAVIAQTVHAMPPPVAPPSETHRYQRPEDLLEIVPVIGELPRTFLFGNGYTMKISGKSLRIDHMGLKSAAQAGSRDCMLGLSYTTAVIGLFTSRVDLPIVFSSSPNPSQWAFSRLGDYTAHFSHGTSPTALLRLVVSAKF